MRMMNEQVNCKRKCLQLKLILIFLLVFSQIFCCSTSVLSASEKIRVGFFRYDGYHMMDENGARDGYGYEFLQHVRGYTNWQYEYIGYEKSWSEMQDMLERGEIDILTSAQKTSTRLKRFDFSKEPIGSSAAIITVKAGNTEYVSNDYTTWNGMRVGMIRDNTRNDGFKVFAAECGFTYVPVYFDDINDAVRELKEGRGIDAIISSSLRAIKGEWILKKFDISPFYVMVKKGNKQLLQEIDWALEQIKSDEPNLYENLMDKYYTASSSEEIAYTFKERAYIQSMQGKKLTAVINPDRLPISSLKDGEFVGIIPDIVKKIIEYSNLNIEIIKTSNRQEYYEAVKSGSVDIRFDSWYNYNEAEKSGYYLTQPYLECSVSCLYRNNVEKISSIALIKNSDISKKYSAMLDQKYQDVVYYDTLDEVVHAVISGKQDAACLYSNVCEVVIYEDLTNSLASKIIPNGRLDFSVAVNEKQDERLYSIMNKSVSNIENDDVAEIINKNMDFKQPIFSILGYVYDNPLFLVVTSLILLVFTAFSINMFWMLHAKRLDRTRLLEVQRINDLLSDALDDAENANKAKSEFLSHMSHEMRTPLNAIIGFMLLAKDADADQVKVYLANSEIAAKQLLSVINDVLDMSAISSGKMKLIQEPFNLRELIQSISGLYFSQCQEKGIDYETKILTQVEESLIGDQLRLGQILNNLLGNATKFTEHGKIELRISQITEKDNQIFLRFEISDSGCGISDELKERLFYPFEQENAAMSRKRGGTGLGLAIVKNLVDMMHGAIKVESVIGEGTTFVVDLPFSKSEEAEDELKISGNFKDLRVLIVDDESIERDYISMLLRGMKVRYACVDDGNQALKELAAAKKIDDKYNVCLIDWKMPTMVGSEAIRAIRKHYGNDIIIIAVSAYSYYNAEVKAREAGADMFLPKPLFRSSLFDLLMSLTSGQVPEEKITREFPDFEGRRILLAEDNEMNRLVITGILKKFNVVCDIADDGKLAVDKFYASKPGYYDAIFMDIHMPNMDGYEATEAIRNSDHPDAEKIQIIALTADAFNEDVTKMLSVNMNAHVAKPIDIKLLLETLTKAFAERDNAK